MDALEFMHCSNCSLLAQLVCRGYEQHSHAHLNSTSASAYNWHGGLELNSGTFLVPPLLEQRISTFEGWRLSVPLHSSCDCRDSRESSWLMLCGKAIDSLLIRAVSQTNSVLKNCQYGEQCSFKLLTEHLYNGTEYQSCKQKRFKCNLISHVCFTSRYHWDKSSQNSI